MSRMRPARRRAGMSRSAFRARSRARYGSSNPLPRVNREGASVMWRGSYPRLARPEPPALRQRQGPSAAVWPARPAGPGGSGVRDDDAPRALDAAVELGEGHALVLAMHASLVGAGQCEGGEAVGRDAPLAEEARVGEARD